MGFPGLVIKNLTRRVSRSLLTLIALSTAIGAVVALLATARGLTKSFADVYEAHSVDIVVSRTGSADSLSASVDVGFASKIQGLPGVAKAAAVLLDTVSLEEQNANGLPALGVDTDSWMMKEFDLLSEADQIDIQKSQQDDTPQVLYLGETLAKRIEMQAGETINLYEEPYLIAGIFKSSSNWENGSVLFPLKTLQEFLDRRGQCTYVNVVVDEGIDQTEINRVISSIHTLDKRLEASPTEDFVENDTRLKVASGMAWMTSAIALIIGTISTLNTMLTSVIERTLEIGILRAIGWPKGRVMLMIVCESLGLSLIASILGTVFAIFGLQVLSSAPQVRGLIVPDVGLTTVLQALLLAVGIGILGALLPAWRAAQQMPTEAFRTA